MYGDFLLQAFERSPRSAALIWQNRSYSYGELLQLYSSVTSRLANEGLPGGAVVSLEADFSPTAVATLLALLQRQSVVVPLTSSVEIQKPHFREVAEVEFVVTVAGATDHLEVVKTGRTAGHLLLQRLKSVGHPGLVLFSSGSTGTNKAAVHDFVPLLEKFRTPRNSKRMISFLLFDHIGGVNTLLYCLSNAGCLITVPDRSPETVAKTIQDHRAEVLPTSPTFLNLLILSEAYKRYSLDSLSLITYGTEPMPASTLKRVNELFPHVRLQQTYGLSELGILRSRSKSDDSLWVKVGGEGFETRVVDGMLEIKAASAMLGYLNASSPFTDDGWFKTGDLVEIEGEYVRFLGRKSEMINVGGEKVYPAEVENVLQTMEGVSDVVVTGESNPIVGNAVRAVVHISTDETLEQFRKRMREFCKGKLPPFKVPQRVELSRTPMHSERFKKVRPT